MFVPADTAPPADPTPDAPATDTPPPADATPSDTGPTSALAAVTAALADPPPADDAEVPAGDAPPADPQAAKPGDKPQEPAPDDMSDDEVNQALVDNYKEGKGRTRLQNKWNRQRDELGSLREQVKDIEPLRERAGQADRFEQAIRDTGMSPENYGRVLTAAAYMNSNDPVKMRQAHAFMQAQTAELGRRLGIEGGGYDPVANDPELSRAVAEGQITPEFARQFAATRGQGQVQADRQQAQDRTWQAQQEHQQAVNDLNEFDAHMTATNELYARFGRQAVLNAMPAIQQLPPARWLAAVKEVYNRMPATQEMMQVRATPPPAAPPAPRPAAPLAGAMPVRPTGNSSAGMVGQPKSALEAVRMSLGR